MYPVIYTKYFVSGTKRHKTDMLVVSCVSDVCFIKPLAHLFYFPYVKWSM